MIQELKRLVPLSSFYASWHCSESTMVDQGVIDFHGEISLGELMPPVVDLARRAGKAIMAIYGERNPAVEDKLDNSPLTQADLVSNELIMRGLAQLTPHWPIISEESHEPASAPRDTWQNFWLVDPLDGTREFLSRNGEFTVNIALVRGSRPILGVVFAPALDKMYFAGMGIGAYRAHRGDTSKIQARGHPDGTKRVVVSRSHGSNEKDLDIFLGDTRNCKFIPMGSSLKLCLVAEGAADLYPRTGPTMEWDTAAGECILVEAGGSMVDLNGDPLRYNKADFRNSGFVASAGS